MKYCVRNDTNKQIPLQNKIKHIRNNNNNAGAVILETMNNLLKAQNALLETNNSARFEYKFTGKNHETLPWIFAAEKFLRVNDFQTPRIRFQRTFSSLNNSYQNRYFLDTEEEDDNTTFESLKTWVLKRYPPPKTKHEFKVALKSMTMYKGEDPNIAYSRWNYKLAKIKSAIKIINEGLKAETTELHPNDDWKANGVADTHYKSIKMKNISIEDRIESLRLMFVIRNNQSRWNNESVINKMTRTFILKEDPKTLDDWDTMFTKMKTKLIPKVLDGQQEYEFISYPADADADNIYTKKRHQPTIEQQHQSPNKKSSNSRKRQRTTKNHQINEKFNEPPQKRQRTGRIKCNRCYKTGHSTKDCYSIRDLHGNIIESSLSSRQSFNNNNNTNRKCTVCGNIGHSSRRCRKREAFKNKRCDNCGRNGHIARACLKPSNNTNNNNNQHFQRYPSQQNKQQQSYQKSKPKKPEINTISSTPDTQSVIDDINQWMSNHDDVTPEIRTQLQSFTQSLLSKCHPRK